MSPAVTAEVEQLEAERLRPTQPVEHEPPWMNDLRRLIAVLAELMLEADR